MPRHPNKEIQAALNHRARISCKGGGVAHTKGEFPVNECPQGTTLGTKGIPHGPYCPERPLRGQAAPPEKPPPLSGRGRPSTVSDRRPSPQRPLGPRHGGRPGGP